MIPASFDYTAPESLADAIAALGGDAEEIKVLAGGQSLIPVLKLRLAAPTLIVDIGKIDDLRGISDAGERPASVTSLRKRTCSVPPACTIVRLVAPSSLSRPITTDPSRSRTSVVS